MKASLVSLHILYSKNFQWVVLNIRKGIHYLTNSVRLIFNKFKDIDFDMFCSLVDEYVVDVKNDIIETPSTISVKVTLPEDAREDLLMLALKYDCVLQTS